MEQPLADQGGGTALADQVVEQLLADEVVEQPLADQVVEQPLADQKWGDAGWWHLAATWTGAVFICCSSLLQ